VWVEEMTQWITLPKGGRVGRNNNIRFRTSRREDVCDLVINQSPVAAIIKIYGGNKPTESESINFSTRFRWPHPHILPTGGASKIWLGFYPHDLPSGGQLPAFISALTRPPSGEACFQTNYPPAVAAGKNKATIHTPSAAAGEIGQSRNINGLVLPKGGRVGRN
jgi:hypothetical protein